MRITSHCRLCEKTTEWEYPTHASACEHQKISFPTDAFLKDETLNQCPLCGCTHVYRQKDFNRKIGVVLIAIGVVFAFFTYGISLVAVTLIDWALNRYVKEVGICYQCQAQFRKSETIAALPTFNLSLFDYYRNLQSQN